MMMICILCAQQLSDLVEVGGPVFPLSTSELSDKNEELALSRVGASMIEDEKRNAKTKKIARRTKTAPAFYCVELFRCPSRRQRRRAVQYEQYSYRYVPVQYSYVMYRYVLLGVFRAKVKHFWKMDS